MAMMEAHAPGNVVGRFLDIEDLAIVDELAAARRRPAQFPGAIGEIVVLRARLIGNGEGCIFVAQQCNGRAIRGGFEKPRLRRTSHIGAARQHRCAQRLGKTHRIEIFLDASRIAARREQKFARPRQAVRILNNGIEKPDGEQSCRTCHLAHDGKRMRAGGICHRLARESGDFSRAALRKRHCRSSR